MARLGRRRGDTNGNQRRIGGAHVDATGRSAFGEVLRGLSGRAAIGHEQHLVVLTLDGALTIEARGSNDPQARARRTGGTARPRGSRRTGRAHRTDRAGIALVAFRPGRTGRPRRALPATREHRKQGGGKHQMTCAHVLVPCRFGPLAVQVANQSRDETARAVRPPAGDQFTAVQVASGLRQAVPRSVCGLPSI